MDFTRTYPISHKGLTDRPETYFLKMLQLFFYFKNTGPSYARGYLKRGALVTRDPMSNYRTSRLCTYVIIY